jgi:hypothetical protein
MNLKTKIFLIILIILIIIGARWLIFKRNVTISVDKTEYEIGESVKILIKTDPNHSIYKYVSLGVPYLENSYCEILENKGRNNWKSITIGCKNTSYTPCWEQTWMGEEIKIYPGETFEHEIKFLKEGTYKVGCFYETSEFHCLIGIFDSCFVYRPDYLNLSFYSPPFLIRKTH